MTDSSGANPSHPFNAAFSSGCEGGAGGSGQTAAVTSPIAVGGPLGTTGASSTVATRWGSFNCGNSGMWIQGPNNSVPTPPLWGDLPATDWVMECWVLPVGTGAPQNRTESQFMSTGTGHFGGTPGGAAFKSRFTTDGNGNDAIELRAESIGVDAGPIGDPVVIVPDRWTHLAVVNDGGATTFYVNGVATGEPHLSVSPPSGVPYIGSGQDTGAPFNGYLDELRYSTFAPGAFTVADLLLLPPGPTFISKPQSASVWDGGAAPFETVMVLNPDNTFQWKRNTVPIPAATGPNYLLPMVAPTDSGSVFSLTVTNNGVGTTTPDATLTVVPPKTEDNNFYRSAIQAEASLLAFFPVDGNTAGSLTNTKDATHHGTLQGAASYDGRTDRSYGQRAVRLRGDGDVIVAANPAYEFTDGTGTIEALVYLENPSAQHPKTIFSLATDASATYYAFQAASDGNSLIYKNDTTQGASWAVSPSLLNRFAHVALVFTVGKVSAFVDGVSLGAKDNTQFGAATGLQAHIGSAGVDAQALPFQPWNGSIDELAIYGDALSDGAIEIHNSRFVFGTALPPPTIESAPTGTWNLLAGGAPIFRVRATGTAPLSYTWKRNDMAVPNNPTATTTAFTILNSTVASSGAYTVTVSNPNGEATSAPFTVNFTAPAASDNYAALVLADGPSAYWRLNETTGTTLKDYAGGNDGTYVPANVDRGVEAFAGIAPDTATHFKSAGVSASIPYTPTLNPTGAYSIEFWAKPDQSGQQNTAVLAAQNRNPARAGYAIYQGLNGSFWEAHIGVSTPDLVLALQGTTPPEAGRWDHVVMTWNGSDTGTLYVNGTVESSLTGGPHLINGSVPLEIGSRFNGGVSYTGTVDEVAFYNYALSLAQVEKHFRMTAPGLGVMNTPVLVGGQVTLTWTGEGTLQESTDLVTWTDVPGNPGSGYTVTVPAGATRFYRLRE
jgi:Concanavalin A-like lectin/glucanases superfamily